jgi:hypothetical protein
LIKIRDTEDNGKQQNRRQWKATEQKTMESNRTGDNGSPTEQKTMDTQQNRRQLRANRTEDN